MGAHGDAQCLDLTIARVERGMQIRQRGGVHRVIEANEGDRSGWAEYVRMIPMQFPGSPESGIVEARVSRSGVLRMVRYDLVTSLTSSLAGPKLQGQDLVP